MAGPAAGDEEEATACLAEVAAAQIYENGCVNLDWVDGSDAEGDLDEGEYYLDDQADGHVHGDGDGGAGEQLCPCCQAADAAEEAAAAAAAAAAAHAGDQAAATGAPSAKLDATRPAQGTDEDRAAPAGAAAGSKPSTPVRTVSAEPADISDGAEVQEEAEYADDAEDGEDFVDPYSGLSPAQIAPRYYDWRAYFPELQILLDNFDVILEEMFAMTTRSWTPWPEHKLYQALDQNGEWKVIPLMHTFPAWDPSRTEEVESNCAACPRTMEMLRSLPGLRTALFSQLGPRTRLSSHQGWADLANHVLRVHLPLITPDPKVWPNSAGMWVEGEVEFHRERDFVVFDDSKLHKAFNASDQNRVVLIFDLLRPESLPKGLATGGHTEQLDQFIEAYKTSLGL